MPVKTERVMPLFKLYFRFVRDAIQLPTPHRLSSEPALRVLMSRIWIQVHARTTSALVRYLPHVFFPPKNKTWEYFSYSLLFRGCLLLRNSCYFPPREEAVTTYYFLLVMETWLGSSVRRKCISQLFFIYVFSTGKPPVFRTDLPDIEVLLIKLNSVKQKFYKIFLQVSYGVILVMLQRSPLWSQGAELRQDSRGRQCSKE